MFEGICRAGELLFVPRGASPPICQQHCCECLLEALGLPVTFDTLVESAKQVLHCCRRVVAPCCQPGGASAADCLAVLTCLMLNTLLVSCFT